MPSEVRVRYTSVGVLNTLEREWFEQPVITIGSAGSCDLVLEGLVSKHCVIVALPTGEFEVQDLSGGRTCINDVPVRSAFLRPDKGEVLKLARDCDPDVLTKDGDLRGDPYMLAVTGFRDHLLDTSGATALGGMVGHHPSMRRLFAGVERFAQKTTTLIVRGETGTGKDLVAHALHQLGPRRDQPFIVFDCAAVAPRLLESALFGHEKGAFTDADARKAGALEAASGGTLFLDEVAELPLHLQSRFLRCLERQEVRPIGANAPIPVDVRVVSATHRDLEAMVDQGTFRQDLFYRLSVVQLTIPPLRTRLSDVPALVEWFLKDLPRVGPPPRCSDEALRAMMDYPWPGNVRELKNEITRAALCAPDNVIAREDLRDEISKLEASATRPRDLEVTTEKVLRDEVRPQSFEELRDQHVDANTRVFMSDLLEQHEGNIALAARAADLSRRQLAHLLHKFDPESPTRS